MRALLALAALVLLLPLAPPAAALLGECVTTNNVTAASFAWTPPCVRIISGDVVTWANTDDFAHNVRSGQDDSALLRALAPACFATTNFDDGQSRTVRFTHDSNGVTASVRNSDNTWGPVRDCDLARDPTSLVSNEASIPFECGLHSGMTGRVLVAQVGWGSG